MSWIVEWNGVEYDIDPSEFTTSELKQVKILTQFRYRKLLDAVADLDPEAIHILFYTVAKRTDPNLKYSEFEGPPLKVFLAGLGGMEAMVNDLGKLLDGVAEKLKPPTSTTTPTSGTDDSASTVDSSGEPTITL